MERDFMKKDNIEEIFRRFSVEDPEPKGELNYHSNYTLLVAVVLSAQATDVSVNKVTERLFRHADTPHKMLELGEKNVRDLIRTVGLFKTKAKNVIALSRKLLAEFDGVVPESREELVTLPGVGRKTANVVLNIAFGHPTIAVDTHLFRVGNRTGLAVGKTPLEVELRFEKVVPKKSTSKNFPPNPTQIYVALIGLKIRSKKGIPFTFIKNSPETI